MPSSTIDIAKEYAPQAIQRFGAGSITAAALGTPYEWTSAKTVVVHTLDLATLGDYTRDSLAGFGAAIGAKSTTQELTLTQDKALPPIIVDKRSGAESGMEVVAAQILGDQLQHVVAPEIDKYRLAAIVTGCPVGNIGTAAITTVNAYAKFLDAQVKLDETRTPVQGRIAFVSPDYAAKLRQDPSFVKNSDLGSATVITGQIGEVDGCAIVRTPSSLLPANVAFVVLHPAAVVAALALTDARIQNDPVGVSGSVVEVRFVHDCFVLATLASGIAVHKVV